MRTRWAHRLMVVVGLTAAFVVPAADAQTSTVEVTFVTNSQYGVAQGCGAGDCITTVKGSAIRVEDLTGWQLTVIEHWGYHACGSDYGLLGATWSMTSANGDGLSGAIQRETPCSGPRFYSVTAGTGAFAGYTAPFSAQPDPVEIFPYPLGIPNPAYLLSPPVPRIAPGTLSFTLTSA